MRSVIAVFLIIVSWTLILGAGPATAQQPAHSVTVPKEGAKQDITVKGPEFRTLPPDATNWMEKRINESIVAAVTEGKVRLEEIAPYLYLQVIPNFAYQGDTGEARLGDDLMELLGRFKVGADTVIMEIPYTQLTEMKLPFSERLGDKLIISPRDIPAKIDLVFYVNMNILTSRVYEALSRNQILYKPVYNSVKRFYRISSPALKAFYMVYVANIAYQIVYTGQPFEQVIKGYIEEIDILFTVMREYEKKIVNLSGLSYDGRYIKGPNIIVDLWFFPDYIKKNNLTPEAVMRKIEKKEPITIEGHEGG